MTLAERMRRWLAPAPRRSEQQQAAVARQCDQLRLYHFRGCPYCYRVKRALRRLQLPIALVVGRTPKGNLRQRATSLCTRAEKCGATILDLNFQMLSPEMVAELRGRGFRVWCWTVDDEAVMDALARWGVEAITTNHPDLMAQWRRRLARPTQPKGK